MKDQIVQEVHGVSNVKRAAKGVASTERVRIAAGVSGVYLRQSSADYTCELTIEEALKLGILLRVAAMKVKEHGGEVL